MQEKYSVFCIKEFPGGCGHIKILKQHGPRKEDNKIKNRGGGKEQ